MTKITQSEFNAGQTQGDDSLSNTATVKLEGKIRLTKWTAKSPVTKRLALEADGSIRKISTAAQLGSGAVEQIECSPKKFLDVLKNIGSNDCLSYGVARDNRISKVLSRKRFDASSEQDNAMTRTADRMTWPDGPAVLMIDYDPPAADKALTKDAFLDVIYSIVPDLKECAHIWGTSTSSCLFDTTSKKEIRGIQGQRLYIIVNNGVDIPRAGKVLFKRLWLNGFGYIKISQAGSLLLRSPADDSVWQTNRIDYCAPPICVEPLASNKPTPLLLGDSRMVLDTSIALPDLTETEENQYLKLVAKAKVESASEAASVRDAYIKARVLKLANEGISHEVAERTIRHAMDGSVLLGDFQLECSDGTLVTVAEVLADPAKWHGKHFSDPLEPDYHDDNRVAYARLLGVPRPYIASYAHGGQRYFLARQLHTVRLAKGERGSYIPQIVSALTDCGAIYARGSTLITIHDMGKISALNEYGILARIDQSVRVEEFKQQSWQATDIKIEHAKIIQNAHVASFPQLKATLTAPSMCPVTSEILSAPGYDKLRGIFITNEEHFQAVILNPTIDDVRQSLKALWYVVRSFPFATKLDQTVMLAAMLTAVIRKMIPTAPGFGFDSPTQGSGKTLLAKLISALAGETPTISPQPDAKSDDEMRKRIFSCLREGHAVVVIDNIVGAFDSPALASMLTSEQYSDRVLGKSKTETVSSNSMVILSGNNLTLNGDLPRRIMMCRIDPKDEAPHQRSFNFDPVQVVTEYRQELVAAALTLIRAYKSSSHEQRCGAGRLASFEDWDDMVRQTICWLAQQQQSSLIPIGEAASGDCFPELVDPMEAVNDAVKHDPFRERHGHLLKSIAIKYGAGNGHGNIFSTRQLVKDSVPDSHNFGVGPEFGDDDDREALSYLLVEVAGDPIRHVVNARSLGGYLSKHHDRIVDGLCLRKGPDKQNVATWWIEDVACGLSGFGGLNNDQYEINSTQHTREQSTKIKPTKPTNPIKAISTRIPHAFVPNCATAINNKLGAHHD